MNYREDSIARRFIFSVMMVIGGTMTLVVLFLTFGGIWAAPSFEQSGTIERALDIYRLIEAAPEDTRPLLAAAAKSDKFRVAWFPKESSVSLALAVAPEGGHAGEIHDLLGSMPKPQMRAVLVEPAVSAVPDDPYFQSAPNVRHLALALPDESWIVYSSDHRFWGLASWERWLIWAGFLILATSSVTPFATHLLVRPITQFTNAIRLFGTNPQASPMPEVGPIEFRGVIAAFNEMQGQIQGLMTAHTAMLAAISHDLRTPLTRIRLRGEFIKNPDQQNRLFRDVDELQHMIDGALAFFRGDAHQEAATSLDLPSILETMVNDFSDQDVEVIYKGPERMPYFGRPLALKRALTNVVENAVKYGTPPEICLFSRADEVVVTITDHGPGIPADALERVFLPFYRMETSRNRTTGGVGLGLTATQSIIREHGGQITLSNRPDGGFVVLIRLPNSASA